MQRFSWRTDQGASSGRGSDLFVRTYLNRKLVGNLIGEFVLQIEKFSDGTVELISPDRCVANSVNELNIYSAIPALGFVVALQPLTQTTGLYPDNRVGARIESFFPPESIAVEIIPPLI